MHLIMFILNYMEYCLMCKVCVYHKLPCNVLFFNKLKYLCTSRIDLASS